MMSLKKLLTFREAATFGEAGLLALWQLPAWVLVWWLLARDDDAAVLLRLEGPPRILVAFGAQALAGLLAVMLLRVVGPALVNWWARRRWGGPTARTDRLMTPIFFVVTILQELLLAAVAFALLAVWLENLGRLSPGESADWKFTRTYVLALAGLAVLIDCGARRALRAKYVGRRDVVEGRA